MELILSHVCSFPCLELHFLLKILLCLYPSVMVVILLIIFAYEYIPLLVGYDDYMSYLCGINGSAPVVRNYTGQDCWVYNSTINGPDLNLPSITIVKLNQSRVVQRLVTNIADNETYSVGWSPPYGVSAKVSPSHFYIASGEKQVLTIVLNATVSNSVASFGRIGLFGNKGHVVNIPLSVIVKITYNTTNS